MNRAHIEAGVSEPRRATLDVIRRAFESAGVEFIDGNGGGPGVRLRKLPRGKQPNLMKASRRHIHQRERLLGDAKVPHASPERSSAGLVGAAYPICINI
jgi:hypothetical protein